MSMLPGNSAPAARSPLQLPVRALQGSHSAVTVVASRRGSVCTPTDAGTSWRTTICPWAPERKAAPRRDSLIAGGSATPSGLATPTGLATPLSIPTPVNFWPAPPSWSGEYCSTPSSGTSIYTPHNAASTIHRTSSCPWAPDRKPAPSLSADSGGSTPSPIGLATPVNFWPGTPVNGCGARRASLPCQGPLTRLMSGVDSTPVAGMRRKSSLDLGQPGSYSTPLSSFTSKNQCGFQGLTPMSMDATPIGHEVSPSNADWLSSYLTEVETPNAALNHARFLDSQPSTPVSISCPVTPVNGRTVMHNAFGMPTVEEVFSPEDARSASPQQPSDLASMEKPKQGDDWMPPAESIMGGA